MKLFRHPNGMIAEHFKTEFAEGYKICDANGLLVFGDERMTKENLIEFGFEEVSDEVGNVEKDWIDVVGDNFLGELFATKDIKFKELTKYCLREQIEKHMPPQKKFTGNDVHEHSMKTYGSDSGFYVNFTLNFLRDHDLLEE